MMRMPRKPRFFACTIVARSCTTKRRQFGPEKALLTRSFSDEDLAKIQRSCRFYARSEDHDLDSEGRVKEEPVINISYRFDGAVNTCTRIAASTPPTF